MRAHRLLLVLVVALACVLHVACGSFGAVETQGADAGTGTNGEAGTALDGGTPTDAASEADKVDGGCAHLFCAFFDGVSPSAEWPTKHEDLGPLALDTQHYVSGPSSLRVVAGPDAAGRESYVEKTFPGAQRYRFSAMVKVETSNNPNGEVDLVDFELDPAPAGFERYFFALIATNGGALSVQRQFPDDVRALLDKTASTFVRAAFDVDLANGRLVVSIDGAIKLDVAIPIVVSTGATLSVGLPFTGNTSGTYDVNIDDVTLD
ncbi:MAG: hypothetical protein JWP87_5723 [Labilithrix sp.]|nr:hypothetical protein [Labilithrix sp.]